MLKLILTRMTEPTRPTFPHDPAHAAWPADGHPQRPIHEHVWRWHLGECATIDGRGSVGPSAEPVAALAAELRSLTSAGGDEDAVPLTDAPDRWRDSARPGAIAASAAELVAVRAAYTLGAMGGAEAAAALAAALFECSPPVISGDGSPGGTDTATCAAYGLVNMADGAAVDAVRRLLADVSTPPAVRYRCLDVLTDIGPAAVAALPELLACLEESGMDERRRAAEALGTVGQGLEPGAATRLAARLAALLADDAEGEVRREAALSLARLGRDGDGVVQALSTGLLDPENVYARGYSAKALERLGSAAALQALVQHLQVVRFEWVSPQ